MKLASFLNDHRAARIAAALLLWLLLATFVPRGPWPRDPGPRVAHLFVAPVALDPADPYRRRVGALVFRRGRTLTSNDRRFGGISSMRVENGQVLALADTGAVLRFALPARPGIARVRIALLADGPGSTLRKAFRDAESLAVADGSVWVGFEGANQIWRYRRADGRALGHAAPPAMRRWRHNSGVESLARLADGRFLAIAEDPDDGRPFSAALLFDGDPSAPRTRAAALRYRRVPGMRPTDAVQLGGGRLLVLNRHYGWLSGLSAALVVVEPDALRPGGTMEWREVARLAPPLTVDNMEALSAACEGGRTIVYLASDDNLSPMQRTLLLEFELDPAVAGPCRPAAAGRASGVSTDHAEGPPLGAGDFLAEAGR